MVQKSRMLAIGVVINNNLIVERFIQLNFPWDQYSDQPHILKRDQKKILREGHFFDFIILLLTNVFYFPYLLVKFLLKNKKINKESLNSSFYGLCVNLDKGDIQQQLVEELGVKSLQIRVFLNDVKNINDYVDFVKSLGVNKEILITIIQDREHIENQELLSKDITIIFKAFNGLATEFQIGNAINRIKWEFVSIEEYLKFFQTIQIVRDKSFKDIKLIGSSVIDFEYHFTIRTLFNSFKVHFDKVASLLYVDRRGSAKNTQMGIFDLENKIEFLDTIVRGSSQASNEIYITETNWPLSGTAPYAPTSEKECVSQEDYSKYMLEYFAIAKQTGKISRVYWHQLIAPGYGLVDNRDGKIRKTKAFDNFKKMIENAN